MSEAADISEMSCDERSCTLENILRRRLRVNDAENLAAKNPAQMDDTRLSRAQSSIPKPSFSTSSWPLPVWMAYVMSFMYSGILRSRYTWNTMQAVHRITYAHSFFVKYPKNIVRPLRSFDERRVH